MNTALRTSLSLAVVAGFSIVGACTSSKPTADILAQDSSLAKEVLSANLDSVSLANADTMSLAPVTPAPVAVEETAAPVAMPQAAPVQSGDRAVAAPKAPRISRETVTRRPVRSGTTARTQSSSTRLASRVSKRTPEARPVRRRSTAVATSTAVGSYPAQRATETNRVVTSPNPTRLRATATIPAGSNLVFAASERVCTGGTTGDRFISETAEDVIGPLGVVIPKGSVASGEIVSGGNGRDLNLRISSLTVRGRAYNVVSEVTDVQLDNVRTRKGSSPAKVIAGAGIGAVLGRVIGGSTKSTVIGAAGGAAAGAVVASQTTRVDRCVPTGGRINARLTEPLKVSLTE